MGLTQANIVDFANVIANGLGSTVTMNIAFDEVMQNLGQKFDPPIMQSTAFTITSGTSQYTMSTNVISMKAVFNEGTQLNQTEHTELEAYDTSWRATTGTPECYTFEDPSSGTRVIHLYPVPNAAATGTWLGSAALQANVPSYLGLYVAFAVLEREFMYPSDHQDKEFSVICGEIAQMFELMLGL